MIETKSYFCIATIVNNLVKTTILYWQKVTQLLTVMHNVHFHQQMTILMNLDITMDGFWSGLCCVFITPKYIVSFVSTDTFL